MTSENKQHIAKQPRANAAASSFEHVGAVLAHLRLQWLLQHFSPRLVWAAYVCINGFITIGLLALLAPSVTGSPFVFPSLGPTAYLFFFSPLAEASSPRNTIYGHAIGLICGYAAFALTTASTPPFAMHAGVHGPRVLAAALSLSATGARLETFPRQPSACRSDHSHRFARHHLPAQRTRHHRGRRIPAHGASSGHQSTGWTTLSTLELSQARRNASLIGNSSDSGDRLIYSRKVSVASKTMGLIIRSSSIHAAGCYTTAPIPRGTHVVEYTGPRISKDLADEKYENSPTTYLFGLGDGEVVIDGHGTAMFINHSCDPNCETEEIDGRVWIIALRNIPAGSEITYDYQLYDGGDDESARCTCGAKKCRNTMYSTDELKKRSRGTKKSTAKKPSRKKSSPNKKKSFAVRKKSTPAKRRR